MKSITFLGAGGGIGTTSFALSTAECIAREGYKVLFIYGSEKAGSYYSSEPFSRSIDDIVPYIKKGRISQNDLMRVTESRNGLDILAGTRLPVRGNLFSEDVFEKILSAAASYDFVITDAGSSIYSGIYLSACNISDLIYHVVTQRPATLSYYMQAEKSIAFRGNVQGLIVNMFVDDKGLYDKERIEDITGAQVYCLVPFTYAGMFSEMIGHTPYIDPYYRQSVDRFAGELLKGLGLKQIKQQPGYTSIKGRIKGKFGRIYDSRR